MTIILKNKDKKGRTQVSGFEKFLLIETYRILRYPTWLLRLYLSTVHDRFKSYRDSSDVKRWIKRHFKKTIFNPDITEVLTSEWNGSEGTERSAKMRYALAHDYISERSCYRVLKLQKENCTPERKTINPGVIAVHLVEIISETEQFSDMQKSERGHRHLLILAERHTGFIRMKLFKDFNEQKLVRNINKFKDKLNRLSISTREIRFIPVENSGPIVTTACNKTENQIKKLLDAEDVIEGKYVTIESTLGFDEHFVIEFPRQYQQEQFEWLIEEYACLGLPLPLAPSVQSIFDMTNIYKDNNKIPNIHWTEVQFRSFPIWEFSPKFCIRACDLIKVGNRPLILKKNIKIDREQLKAWANKFNIGKDDKPSPPIALMWKNYESITPKKDRMIFKEFRKLMELR